MNEDANLYALFERRFAEAGEAVAFTLSDGTEVSYRALAEAVARSANALVSLGIVPGDRVSVQVEKSLANVFLYLATLKAGAVYQPLNTAYTPAEVSHFANDARPKLMVVDPAHRHALETVAAKAGVAAVETLDGRGEGSFAGLAATMDMTHDTVPRAADDLAGLLYTSGTTGRSKGAMISHRNLASNATTLHRLWGFEPGDVLLHALPIYHVHGLQVALHTAFLNKSEIIWLDRFDPAQVCAGLPRASVMMGVPTFYTRLLAHPEFDRRLCANMRLFISGSAPLLAETHSEFEARSGHRILERYGMTEAGMITSNPLDGARIAGTVGFALPGVDVRVADGEGRELPRGEVGILEAKGPNIFKGYWNLPEKTKEEFRNDGYFITGDMATMDDGGRITLVGRARDLIISGGLNVYPKEIEIELDGLAGVGESAVIGVPHPGFGEGVVAVITETAPGAAPPPDKIIADLGRRLARFKLPKRIFVTAELPRNTMGKVQKSALRRTYSDALADSAI